MCKTHSVAAAGTIKPIWGVGGRWGLRVKLIVDYRLSIFYLIDLCYSSSVASNPACRNHLIYRRYQDDNKSKSKQGS